MPASTPFLGLYKPGGGSTGLIAPDEVVDIDRLNTNADLIDAFAKSYGPATERSRQLYGPAASLGGVSGMKLGDTYQESDGNKVLWKYDGTNWVTNEGGMYLIRPSSVGGAGVTLDAPSGATLLALTAAGVASLNGVFSARFREYQVSIILDSALVDSDVFLRFRNGGADNVSAVYGGTRLEWAVGIPVAKTDYSGGTEFPVARVSTAGAYSKVTVTNPGRAVAKAMLSDGVDSVQYARQHRGFAALTSAVDGISFRFGAGVTGAIKVYGLA